MAILIAGVAHRAVSCSIETRQPGLLHQRLYGDGKYYSSSLVVSDGERSVLRSTAFDAAGRATSNDAHSEVNIERVEFCSANICMTHY